MAIADTIPGLKVEIVIADNPVAEYDRPDHLSADLRLCSRPPIPSVDYRAVDMNGKTVWEEHSVEREIKHPFTFNANSIFVDDEDDNYNQKTGDPHRSEDTIDYAEYGPNRNPRTKVVEKFVTLETETHPAVRITYSKDFRFLRRKKELNAIRSEVKVDSRFMDSNITNFKYKKVGRDDVVVKNIGNRISVDGKYEVKQFHTKRLEIVDKDSCHEYLMDTGTFSISFWRVSSSQRSTAPRNRDCRGAELPEKVPEKVIKGQAITVAMGLDAAHPTGVKAYLPQVLYDCGDPKERPFATFHFHYRTAEAMRHLRVITPSPSPTPPPEDPGLDLEYARPHWEKLSVRDRQKAYTKMLARWKEAKESGSSVQVIDGDLSITDDRPRCWRYGVEGEIDLTAEE